MGIEKKKQLERKKNMENHMRIEKKKHIEKKKQIKNQVMQALKNGACRGVCNFDVVVEERGGYRYFTVKHLEHEREGTTITIYIDVYDDILHSEYVGYGYRKLFEFHTSLRGTDKDTGSYSINDFFKQLEEDTKFDEFFERIVKSSAVVGECYIFTP